MGKFDESGTANIYSKYNNQNYLSPNEDFIVNKTGKAIVHAGNQIEFLPGTTIEQSGELSAYIETYRCSIN